METERLKVMQMGCNACVKKVTSALSKLDGVAVVNVTVGEAIIRLDTSRVGRDDVIAALEGAGYPASWNSSGESSKDERDATHS